MKTSKINSAAPKRGRRQSKEEPGPSDRISAVMRERDRLCAEAREHPGSDAFDIVRAYVMTGMLASRQASDADSANSQPPGADRDRDLRDKISRLAQVAEAAEEASLAMDEKKYAHAHAMVGRIAEMVGLAPPGYYEQQRQRNQGIADAEGPVKGALVASSAPEITGGDTGAAESDAGGAGFDADRTVQQRRDL